MRSFTRFIGANCRYGQRKKGVELGATTLIKYIERDLDIEYINNFEEEGYLVMFPNCKYNVLPPSNLF